MSTTSSSFVYCPESLPQNPVSGNWYICKNEMFLSDGSSYIKIGPQISVSTSTPSTGTTGEIIIYTTDNKIKYYNGSEWVAIGGGGGQGGSTNWEIID